MTTVLDTLADSFNPLLTIFALVVPFLRRPRRFFVYYLSAGVAIAFVYLVRALDERLQIWAAVGLDYSTHSAFAASLAVSISWFHQRARIPLLVLVIAYFGLVLFLGYHTVGDMLSSAFVAAAIAFLSGVILRRP